MTARIRLQPEAVDRMRVSAAHLHDLDPTSLRETPNLRAEERDPFGCPVADQDRVEGVLLVCRDFQPDKYALTFSDEVSHKIDEQHRAFWLLVGLSKHEDLAGVTEVQNGSGDGCEFGMCRTAPSTERQQQEEDEAAEHPDQAVHGRLSSEVWRSGGLDHRVGRSS